MAAREIICAKSKLGHSLGQISELTGLAIDGVETLGRTTGLSPEVLSNIIHMKQNGLGLEQISQEFGVDLAVLKQFTIGETVGTQIDALAEQGKALSRSVLMRELTRLTLLTTARPTPGHLRRRLKRPTSLLSYNLAGRSLSLSTP
jgi:hypothetical protein